MQIKTTRNDVLWNYAGTVVSMVGNFAILPFLIYFLSGEELGLWYVYLAVGNLVMLFEFGFSPTFSRNFAFCWGGATELTREGCVRSDDNSEVNPQLMAYLISTCRMVYRRVSLIALVLLALPGTLFVLSVTGGLDSVEVLVSWAIYSFAVLLNLYFLWYAAALRGIGSVAADNQVMIAARLTQVLMVVALLFAGVGLIGASIGFLSNAAVYRFLGGRKFWHDERIKHFDLKSVHIEKARRRRLYKTISYNAYRDGGVQLANYASTQVSSLICSSFLGLEQAGAFSIALQFATAIGNMSQALMTSCRPMLQSAFQRGDKPLVQRTLGSCAAVYVGLFVIMSLAVLVLIYPLLNIFKPDSNFDPAIYCGVCVYMFLFDWCALFASMLANMNTIPYMKAYVISAVAGIALSILLVNISDSGAWGLILGLAIPQCVYNVWKWPMFTAEKIDTSPIALLNKGVSICCNKIKAYFQKHR